MILWRKIKQPRGIIFTGIPDKVTFGEIIVGNEELACSCVGKEHLRQGEQPSVHRPLGGRARDLLQQERGSLCGPRASVGYATVESGGVL